MDQETRYQRVARLQHERQTAREARWAVAHRKRARKARSIENDSGPGYFRDPDGLDRDNLGASHD